jgi:glycosyltransferase involved in cell wall biosynthesis
MMKRYNLLFTTITGQMIGGGQRSLLLILEKLNKKRFKPFLICPSEGDFTDKAEKLGIETTIIKTRSLKRFNFFSNAATIFKLIKFIKQKNIDLIHTDAPRQTFYAGIAARLAGKPLIWHVRISDPEENFYDKFLLTLSSKVIAVSKAVRERLEEVAPRSDKFVVIYNGVDLTEFSSQLPDKKIKEEFGIEDDLILVGTVGQLIPGKGQDIFLRAAAQVSKLFPNVKFIIVGDGNEAYRKKLEDLSKELRIAEKVIFTGFREDIPQIMSSLDIFVLSSTNLEGFSRVILEGMASRKPVIASRVGGNPEAVEDGKTGIIVPPEDPAPLADAILELVKNEDKRSQMGEAGRRRVEKLFSIEKNIAQIEKLYEELLCRDM